MAEVLVRYTDVVLETGGRAFIGRACGAPVADGLWHAWIEFESDDGTALRSPRETTQPNREAAVYWATGLTPVYLEGALHRAVQGPLPLAAPDTSRPIFDGPAPDHVPAPARSESVLNPLSVYQKGEAVLRAQLGALSAWHLVNIIRAYGSSVADQDTLNLMTHAELAELIVSRARDLVNAR